MGFESNENVISEIETYFAKINALNSTMRTMNYEESAFIIDILQKNRKDLFSQLREAINRLSGEDLRRTFLDSTEKLEKSSPYPVEETASLSDKLEDEEEDYEMVEEFTDNGKVISMSNNTGSNGQGNHHDVVIDNDDDDYDDDDDDEYNDYSKNVFRGATSAEVPTPKPILATPDIPLPPTPIPSTPSRVHPTPSSHPVVNNRPIVAPPHIPLPTQPHPNLGSVIVDQVSTPPMPSPSKVYNDTIPSIVGSKNTSLKQANTSRQPEKPSLVLRTNEDEAIIADCNSALEWLKDKQQFGYLAESLLDLRQKHTNNLAV